MRRIPAALLMLAAILLVSMIFSAPAFALDSVTVSVTTAKDTVHVPVSPVQHGSVGSNTWASSSLNYHYITATGDGSTVGLVDGLNKILSVAYDGSSKLSMRGYDSNKIYVAFTGADYASVEARTKKYIVEETWDDEINPSFGYRLLEKYPVKLSVEYSTTDLTTNKAYRAGQYAFIIRNAGLNSTTSKPMISITRRD